MVRLFDKIKDSLTPLNKRRSTQQPNQSTTTITEPESNAPGSLDPPVTPVATAPSEPVSDASASPEPETPLQPSPPPIIMKRAPSVKIYRIRSVAKPTEPVTQESSVTDIDDKENATSKRVYVVSRKLMQKRKHKRKGGITTSKYRVTS